MPSDFSSPVVSVLIANHNRAEYLASAVRSALRQTLRDIEVIIVDDASSDESEKIALGFAESDDRVRFIGLKKNAGPGGARNAALEAARGTWVAILDSDDFMHPERLERLVAEAQRTGAEICADDLLVFGAGLQPSGFLSKRQRQLGWLTFPEFIASNAIFAREPVLGYLKPLFKRSFLDEHGIRYDASLTIGEDYDILARAFAHGAKFRLLDSLGYFYRKHPQSTSHRLSQKTLAPMLEVDARLQAGLKETSAELTRSFAARAHSIKSALAFDDIITALKRRSWAEAARVAYRNPSAVPLLRMPIAARLSRLLALAPKQKAPAKAEKELCLISRQRLLGAVNGSSIYLLGICSALRNSGHRLTLVSPYPGTGGRWPFFYLGTELEVFSDIHMRGVWRIGKRLCISKDPRVFLAAAKSVAARLAAKVGIDLSAWDRQFPYAIGAPWDREQFLYVSRFAPSDADVVIADYAFATPAIPFALSENARSMVVMHDLLSERASRFRDKGLTDSVITMSKADEMRLLGEAEAVIAIQDVEAKIVQASLPDHPVLLTPLAHETVSAPQPGGSRSIFFVGSNTAPNIIGLKWFLDEIWPLILAKVPDCQLSVAGGVGTAFNSEDPKVRFLGQVPSLAPFYSEAGVVVSPLTVGSGLKIKIGEALSHGKAVVATSVSVEGISGDVLSTIAVSDEPAGFARAVSDLLLDDGLRATRAREAFDAYRHQYSEESCYRQLLAFLSQPRGTEAPVQKALSEKKQLERTGTL